jgi:hypothetical protein
MVIASFAHGQEAAPAAGAARPDAAKPGAAAPGKIRVILGGVEPGVLTAEQAASMQIAVCAEFAAIKGLDVVCPGDVAAIMRERELMMALGTCSGEACGKGIDKLLQGEFSVYPMIDRVSSTEDKCAFTIVIKRGPAETALSRVEKRGGCSFDKLCKLVKGLAEETAASMEAIRSGKIAPPPAAPRDLTPGRGESGQ